MASEPSCSLGKITASQCHGLTLLISPLKTTSSALSCSTFMASSSWHASASWASCPRAEGGAHISPSKGQQGAGQGGRGAHLLQLCDSVLKLDTNRVLLFPSRERNALLRSRAIDCRREQTSSCSPHSNPKEGKDGSGAEDRTCPGIYCHLFPVGHNC